MAGTPGSSGRRRAAFGTHGSTRGATEESEQVAGAQEKLAASLLPSLRPHAETRVREERVPLYDNPLKFKIRGS
jgi:hypothetical protein